MELGPYGGVLRCSFAETVAFLEGMSLAVSSCYYGIVIVVAVCFFFFQAEDGIRDWSVTGVQTCALPIWHSEKPLSCIARLRSVGVSEQAASVPITSILPRVYPRRHTCTTLSQPSCTRFGILPARS